MHRRTTVTPLISVLPEAIRMAYCKNICIDANVLIVCALSHKMLLWLAIAPGSQAEATKRQRVGDDENRTQLHRGIGENRRASCWSGTLGKSGWHPAFSVGAYFPSRGWKRLVLSLAAFGLSGMASGAFGANPVFSSTWE